MDDLREDDTISFPNCEDGSPVRADAVVALRETGSERLFELGRGYRFTVGGDPSCDVVLEDPYVSAVHCLIERQPPDRTLIRDNDSKNGVFVGRSRVEVADLRPGDRLRVGQSELVALSARSRKAGGVIDDLIGDSERFRRALDLAVRAGRGEPECSVLILGETGTGKELFAQVVHEASRRAGGPYVAINCGGLSSELIGSELFGHVRGAFTGATDSRPGVFALADGGTLFLDELGELPPDQQPHLLRALEGKRVRAIGANVDRAVDVRFVAATNRLGLVSSGALREDLYHRVATVVIELPPLRERVDDIPLLVGAFLDELCGNGSPRFVREQTMDVLMEYPWHGNVRELRHAVMRAMTLCDAELTLEALLPQKAPARPIRRVARPRRVRTRYNEGMRDMLEAALRSHGSARRAARALGIPKSTFCDRLKRFGIKIG